MAFTNLDTRILSLLPSTPAALLPLLYCSRQTMNTYLGKGMGKLWHAQTWQRAAVSGRFQPVLVKGPGKNAVCKLIPLDNLSRKARHAEKRAAAGERERDLQKRRAIYAAQKMGKKGDPLVQALFGRTQTIINKETQ